MGDATRKFTDYEIILEFLRRRQHDPETSMMVDVGAQIGLWSRAYVKMGWQVLAFEPEPRNFATLCENIAPETPNFHPHNLAIGEHAADEMRLFYSTEHIGIHSLMPNHKELDEETYAVVRVSTLDDELETLDSHLAVRLVKLDIEGAELPALRSLSWDKVSPDVVICEYGARSQSFGYSFRDLASYGMAQGYRCFLSQKANLSTDFVWLGRYEHAGAVPDNAWGELTFVRSDLVGDFAACFGVFDLPFETALT